LGNTYIGKETTLATHPFEIRNSEVVFNQKQHKYKFNVRNVCLQKTNFEISGEY